MANGFSLRPATPDDVSAIAKIESRVHPAPWGSAEVQTELEKPYSQFLVMTDDETDQVVAGYVVSWFMFDECQILNVAVDFPHRGLGFAREMIRRTIAIAHQRGIRKILLEVRKSNVAAIQLYQSLKFVIIHVRKAFYSNGEDAYQMALYLNEPAQETDEIREF